MDDDGRKVKNFWNFILLHKRCVFDVFQSERKKLVKDIIEFASSLSVVVSKGLMIDIKAEHLLFNLFRISLVCEWGLLQRSYSESYLGHSGHFKGHIQSPYT